MCVLLQDVGVEPCNFLEQWFLEYFGCTARCRSQQVPEDMRMAVAFAFP
jgi:hypothetical protein